MTPPPAQEPAPPLRVRVPASTSNLGPGFDQLGLALELYLEVELEPVTGPPGLTWGTLEGEAAGWPRSGNLLAAALEAGAGGGPLPGAARLHARSEIPQGRGLGSSGAAVARGVRGTVAGATVGSTTGDRAGEQRSVAKALAGGPAVMAAQAFSKACSGGAAAAATGDGSSGAAGASASTCLAATTATCAEGRAVALASPIASAFSSLGGAWAAVGGVLASTC